MAWFLNKMKQGDTFVDVGANIGIYSLHAAKKIGDSGTVLAFEPTPETFRILRNNVELNRLRNVKCHQFALSDRAGVSKMVAGDRPASNRLAAEFEENHDCNGISVAKFDDFCKTNLVKKVDFIKVDIEGGEKAFFAGAIETLRKHKPIILFESIHTGPEFPEREFLRAIGYQLNVLEKGELVVYSDSLSTTGNLIAV